MNNSGHTQNVGLKDEFSAEGRRSYYYTRKRQGLKNLPVSARGRNEKRQLRSLNQTTSQPRHEIIEDFYRLCITKKVLAEGGVEYARDVLKKLAQSRPLTHGADNKIPADPGI